MLTSESSESNDLELDFNTSKCLFYPKLTRTLTQKCTEKLQSVKQIASEFYCGSV